MFRGLVKRWRDFMEARRRAREIAPEAFIDLSAELREMAEVVSKLRHSDPAFQPRLARIMREMTHLESLATKPGFKRLPLEKRMELRRSLLASREQLLESMSEAPAATDTLQ